MKHPTVADWWYQWHVLRVVVDRCEGRAPVGRVAKHRTPEPLGSHYAFLGEIQVPMTTDGLRTMRVLTTTLLKWLEGTGFDRPRQDAAEMADGVMKWLPAEIGNLPLPERIEP